MKKLIRLAHLYFKYKKIYDRKGRFDVVAILIRGRFAKKSIRLIKNAFNAEE
jgi:Holliday junction resolvase-like predicted endonuclease